MSEPFLGEIRMFAGNFAPRDWAFCEGQLISAHDFGALFSLLGTIYGGDGTTNFALPDMRGRIPAGEGNGVGLTPRTQGRSFGTEMAPLTMTNMPDHTHDFMASTDPSNADLPTGKVLANTGQANFYEDITGDEIIVPLSQDVVSAAGGNYPHPNLMPALCVNFIIALKGVYPSRN